MPRVLITGANRGLGLEFARRYAAAGWDVVATCRDPGAADALRALDGAVRVDRLDMRDLAGVAAYAQGFDGTLDLLIANAGISGPQGGAGETDGPGWVETLAVNCVAPTILAAGLCGKVAAVGGKLVAISSRMGSIADNDGGGSIAYRSSKAALNAAWRNMALDFREEPVTIAMLHPGWVRTDMGGPNAHLAIEDSIAQMFATIERLTRSQSGAFLNLDGTPLPW